MSIAKIPEVWPGKGDVAPGNKPYGEFVGDNLGISVLREGREIEFIKKTWGYRSKDESTDRWWGIEIDFPRELDDYFGVINNKQGAVNLNEIAKYNSDEIKEKFGLSGFNESQYDELKDADYASYVVVKVVHRVNMLILNMASEIKKHPYNIAKRNNGDTSGKDVSIADKGVNESDDVGKGVSDRCLKDDDGAELRDMLKKIFTAEEVTTIEDAHKYNHKFAWIPSNLNYTTLFDVQIAGPVIVVKPNVEHRIYKHIFQNIIEINTEKLDEKSKEMIKEIETHLKLIMECWARMEDEASTRDEKQKLQQMRGELGIKLDKWLSASEKLIE